MSTFLRNFYNLKGFVFNSIFLFISMVLMHSFPNIVMIVLVGYDCLLFLCIICRIFHKKTKIDYICDGWALVAIGMIGFELQSNYYLVSTPYTMIVFFISLTLGIIISYLVNKANGDWSKISYSIALSLVIALGMYGQIFLINDVCSSESKEITFTITEKEIIAGRTKQLVPDYYITIDSDTIENVRVFLTKGTFEKLEVEDRYCFQVYKGAFDIWFLKHSEMVYVFDKL